MARGGKRSGSGRPPGAVTKVTAEKRQAAVESGQTPLDYMLSVMRDSSEFPERRDRMASPQLHICTRRFWRRQRLNEESSTIGIGRPDIWSIFETTTTVCYEASQ